MTRRWQLIVPLVLGTVLGAVFLGFMVYAAGRGDPRDFLARWVRALSLTPLTGTLVGACLGAAIGGLVAWLTLKHVDDLAEVSRQMNFTFAEAVPAEMLARVKGIFPNLEFFAPSNWMVGTREGLEIGLLDCTVFEKNGLAPAGTHVRKTLAFVLAHAPAAASFQIRPQGPVFGWPFSLLLALLRVVGAAFGSGPEVERRFRKNYDLLWLGRSVDADIIRRLLGADGLSFFAEHAGWSVLVERGSLAAWQEGLAESGARDRPKLVDDVSDIYHRLHAAAATVQQDKRPAPELIPQ